MSHKDRLIGVGMGMLLAHGYGSLGIQTILDTAQAPKGSFYHHFKDKEDYALQVVDAYVVDVHKGLDYWLGRNDLLPLDRIRSFFDAVKQSYAREGYLGCLMGGLGQELCGVNEAFRRKIEWCLSSIADQLASCLDEARLRGQIAATTDIDALANLIVDCWEGAALRSRIRRDAAPLDAMLDFCLGAVDRNADPI